jgi:hypothetical protein
MKKKNNILNICGLLAVLLIAVYGCDMDDDGGKDDSNNGFLALARMDIVDANNLLVTSATDNSGGLYKTTDNGKVEKVPCFDKDDNLITGNIWISEIYNVNSTYIIVSNGYSGGYLVRKSDGAAFSLNNVGAPNYYGQSSNYKNAKLVQSDGSGNIYFCKHAGTFTDRTIIKINVSNPNSLTSTEYIRVLDTGYQIVAYDVNPQGNVIYSGDVVNRIKKGNGGLINLQNNITWWIDFAGKIKYYCDNKITTYTFDSNYNATTQERNVGSLGGIYQPQCNLLRFSNRILIVGSNSICEIENPTDTPRQITISEITSIILVSQSNDHYYLAGNNSSNKPILLKINPDNDNVTTLLSPDQYDVYTMTAGNDNIVTFNALRMSDGARVIGEISASCQVRILDTALNTEVVVLERIR